MILLKNKSDDADVNRIDPYELEFPNCTFVPIMNYANINLAEAQQFLNSTFNGIIVTSQRAVDAIKYLDFDKNVPVYTVGPTTAERLKTLGFHKVLGAQTGTGVALAEFMVAELPPNQKLLFFAGEVHRRQLPNKLIEMGHSVETIVVYRTEPNTAIAQNLGSIAKEGDWIVFFSPSHTDMAIEIVRRGGLKIAAIGPTTRDFLESQGLEVLVMAAEPSARGLRNAIENYERI